MMKQLAAVLFPGFELLDVFGPLEMFGVCTRQYEVLLAAETAGPVDSSQGPAAMACALESLDKVDMILLPGGRGTRQAVKSKGLLDQIRRLAGNAEIVMSVCTGTSILAHAGLIDGRRATTNKIAFNWVARQSDKVEWVPQARWVEDGNVFTSSGVSAGMDMSLAVIARQYGMDLADKAAVWTEYEWHRDADWDPFAKICGLV